MPPGPAGAAAALRAGGRAHSGAAAPMVGGGSLAGSKDGRSGGSRISGGIKSSKDTNHASHSLRNGAGKHGVNNAGGHAADHHSSNNSQRTSSSGNAGKLGAETSRQLQTALAPASSTGGAASASVAPAACSTVATCGSGGAAADEDSDDLMSSKNDDIAKKLEQAEKLSAAMRVLKFAVPAKNLLSCYLLGPVVLGECRTERLCMPWVNVLLLVVDISVFTGHLIMGIKRRAYREHILAYNFYILSVFWSVWNLCSHPLCRQYVVDLFVAPPELHVTINIVAIAVCSSAIMSPPSMRHLIGLVTWEFLISLVLSSVEVMNFTMDTGWLAAVPKLGGEDSNETMGMRPDVSESTIAEVEQVMFNIAILLIGSTIILGTMTVEKDFKSLAHEMERLGPSGTFEDDLERRKRAVLTALCDAVLTTNAQFQVTGSDDGADRIFRRPMLDQQLGDFFKDQAEKDRFFASVKKQFPEDDSVGEGPKRMRVTLRDNDGELFDADVVVSDASTDKNGKVHKYMVGMHIRGEFRARALDPRERVRAAAVAASGASGGGPEKRNAACGPDGSGVGGGAGQGKAGAGCGGQGDAAGGDERTQYLLYEELNSELFAAFEGVLQVPQDKPPPQPPDGSHTAGKCSDRGAQDSSGGAPKGGPAAASAPTLPRFHLRRATCEVFRRRTHANLPSRVGPGGERHVDLRRLSLPEPISGLT